MKHVLRLTCLASILIVSASHAQIASDNGQIPLGPLIVSAMPDMASWSIDYAYTAEATADTVRAKLASYQQAAQGDPVLAKMLANPQSLFALLAPRPKRAVITKTGSIRHEQREWEQKFNGDLWWFGGYEVERRPYSSQLIAAPTDRRLNDFPEFEWISKDNFTGIKKFGSADCLSFQQAVDPNIILNPRLYAQMHGPVPPPDQRVSTTAYIDLKTRYPVALVFNSEPRRYTILTPPTSVLEVPAAYMAAMNAAKVRLEAATKPLSPP